MADPVSTATAEEIVGRFRKRTPQSADKDARAKRVLPGGDTRTGTYYLPYATYMERGEGCFLTDSDGNRYLDFLNNYTSLIHGHAHARIVDAARRQLDKGTVLGSPADVTTLHAETLCARIPGLEQVRYCNSGTEATLFAMRAARAFTRRDLIVKVDGGYHGSHDYVEVSVFPDVEERTLPRGHIESQGVPHAVLDGIRVVPFNDLPALDRVLQDERGRVAAVILEPMLGVGGQVPPTPGYLRGVRELAHRDGTLLIFDEVISFRLSIGGLQALEGVRPDLTALGKIIGGGFPIGAFGGRRDIMAPFDPAHPQNMLHSGTFNGNNITMAAGLAALEAYDEPAIEHVNRLGDRLRAGFNQAFAKAGIKGQATGRGSLVQVHWRAGEITNARETAVGVAGAADLPRLFHLEMLNRGVIAAPRAQYATSTPMTIDHIDQAIAAFEGTIETLMPYIVEKTPHLLG